MTNSDAHLKLKLFVIRRYLQDDVSHVVFVNVLLLKSSTVGILRWCQTSLFVWRRQPDENVTCDSLSSEIVSRRDPAPTLLCTILRLLSRGVFNFVTCPILSFRTKSLYVIVVELLFSFFWSLLAVFEYFYILFQHFLDGSTKIKIVKMKQP